MRANSTGSALPSTVAVMAGGQHGNHRGKIHGVFCADAGQGQHALVEVVRPDPLPGEDGLFRRVLLEIAEFAVRWVKGAGTSLGIAAGLIVHMMGAYSGSPHSTSAAYTGVPDMENSIAADKSSASGRFHFCFNLPSSLKQEGIPAGARNLAPARGYPLAMVFCLLHIGRRPPRSAAGSWPRWSGFPAAPPARPAAWRTAAPCAPPAPAQCQSEPPQLGPLGREGLLTGGKVCFDHTLSFLRRRMFAVKFIL